MTDQHPDHCIWCDQKIRDGEPVIEVRRAHVNPDGHVSSDRWFPTRPLYQHADQCRP